MYCGSNQLTSLDVRNGNNSILAWFDAPSNLNLTCIEVDDAAYSTTNWTNIDAQTSFSENCSILGIGDFEMDNFNVYPNPSEGNVYIYISEKATYQLVNLTGQVKKQGKLVNGLNHLNLMGYNKSMYFITIKTAYAIHTEKVLLK